MFMQVEAFLTQNIITAALQCLSVCLSVQTITFECIFLEALFYTRAVHPLHYSYIGR